MRVRLISASDAGGGAMIAATRLFQALREAGVPSDMVVNRASTSLPGVTQINQPGDNRLYGLIMREITSNRTELSNTIFSFGFPFPVFPEWVYRDCDVINFHWTADFCDASELGRARSFGKGRVVTLHDEWPYTGGCHYTSGCDGFVHGCANCPQLQASLQNLPPLVLGQKCRWMDPAIVVVAPSRWIADQARKSAVFANNSIRVIPNPVDLQVFQPMDRQHARRALGLPIAKKLILAGSASNWEKRKGLTLLSSAVARLDNETELVLVGARRKALDLPGHIKCHLLGNVATSEMPTAYSAADLFLVPSLEDNLPNMAVESMACGTPVVGFSIGGMPDIVSHDVDGWLCPTIDSNLLGKSLVLGLKVSTERQADIRANCRKKAEQYFSSSQVVPQYIEAFDEARRRSTERNAIPQAFQGNEGDREFARCLVRAADQALRRLDQQARAVRETPAYRLGNLALAPLRLPAKLAKRFFKNYRRT